MSIRAVFFDIGGVLEHTPDTGFRARWEAELGLRPGEVDERLAEVWREGAIGRLTEHEVAQATRSLLGLDAAGLERFIADAWSDYLGSPNAELIAYFSELATRSELGTGIISNSFVGAREREHARYGFADITSTIVYSHEVGVAKPDRRIFEIACERLDVTPSQSVFVDDVAGHVEAAHALGFRAILFETTASAIRAIEAALGR